MRRGERGGARVGVRRRVEALLAELRGLGSERDRAGMARYGIDVSDAFGVSVCVLRGVARRLGTDHALALALWRTGNHEAQLLACFVDDPAAVTERQLESWVRDLRSWDLCDQAATSLFDLTPFAWAKAAEWMEREAEFERRAGFALVAGLAVHDRNARDRDLVALLPALARGAEDGRNYVRKAVSWALRNIGKRNVALNRAAIACAEQVLAAAHRRAGGERGGDAAARSARWVARDALRELRSEAVQRRLARAEPAGERRPPPRADGHAGPPPPRRGRRARSRHDAELDVGDSRCVRCERRPPLPTRWVNFPLERGARPRTMRG